MQKKKWESVCGKSEIGLKNWTFHCSRQSRLFFLCVGIGHIGNEDIKDKERNEKIWMEFITVMVKFLIAMTTAA